MQFAEKDYYKRMAVFCFYDKDGHVDDYVIFLLKAISEHCKNVTVVVNGFATPDSERRLKLNSTQLIYRDNYGYDFAAYKQAVLETKNIKQYDEILFFNQTIFGPVYSLNTIFSTMSNKKKADFWSITRSIPLKDEIDEEANSENKSNKAESDEKTNIAEFIDCAFFAVRRNMASSEHFVRYFEELEFSETTPYEPKKQGGDFTAFFSEKGYNFTTYLNVEKLEKHTDNTGVDMPCELLKLGCPFFKRNALLKALHQNNEEHSAKKARELYNYIRTQTDYPVAFINKNLHRTLPPAAIYKALALFEDVQEASGRTKRTAAVMWFATENLGEVLCSAAVQMQKDTSLLCLFASDELRDKFLPKLPPKAQAIVTAENGFAYLFGKLWKDVAVFENVFYCHNNLAGEDNLLDEGEVLLEILNSLNPGKCGAMLAARKDYGAFVPLPVTTGTNLTAGMNWKEAREALLPLLKSAQINVPPEHEAQSEGFSAYGSMFLARTSAVENLSKFDFNDSLFKGANAYCDYLIPLCVQNSGYHTVVTCTAQQTFDAFTNCASKLRRVISSVEGEYNGEIKGEKIVRALKFYDEYYSEINRQSGDESKHGITHKITKYIKKIAKK